MEDVLSVVVVDVSDAVADVLLTVAEGLSLAEDDLAEAGGGWRGGWMRSCRMAACRSTVAAGRDSGGDGDPGSSRCTPCDRWRHYR